MSAALFRWAPAALLLVGALFTVGIDVQRSMPLRSPLAEAVPMRLLDHTGRDQVVSEEEQRVAGMDDYVLRVFESPAAESGGVGPFSLYVGYYERQTQGRTIHSPKNCLPGGGWEALVSRRETLATAAGALEVNRYLLQRDNERALVLYWYQGRGRTEANEYRVKLDLLRDAALHGRSEEALVRIVVPVTSTEEEAFQLAARVAQTVMPAIHTALPT